MSKGVTMDALLQLAHLHDRQCMLEIQRSYTETKQARPAAWGQAPTGCKVEAAVTWFVL